MNGLMLALMYGWMNVCAYVLRKVAKITIIEYRAEII
jgi:hypothetical protein